MATATPSSSLEGSTGRPSLQQLGSAPPITKPRPACSSISRSFQLSPMARVSVAQQPVALLQEGHGLRLAHLGVQHVQDLHPGARIDGSLDPRSALHEALESADAPPPCPRARRPA